LDIKPFIDLAERHWHKPTGLIFSFAAAILFVAILLNYTKANSLTNAICYSIIAITVIIIWFYDNRYPKIKKGKVGFAVSIQCSNEEEHKKIREDFITTLRQLLKGGALGNTFHFIELPKHISETINDTADAFTLKRKTGAHFVIYGRVRLRTIDGKECHLLDLEGIVGHRPLPQEVSDQISGEFSELFPRRVRISTENDLLAFNFTSDWTECAAKYIIAFAASYSHDLNYAEKLYTELQNKLNCLENTFPIYVKLRQRIPIRLAEIHQVRARIALDHFRKSKNEKFLLEFSANLKKIGQVLSNDYEVLLLKTVEAFLNERNIQKALGFIKKCKTFNDPVWHLNLAFLKAYEGYLGKAIQEYQFCLRYEIAAQTLSQIEDFICWILDKEPDKYQYYYCLGFFNWKLKGDLYQAVKDFMAFLKSAEVAKFEKEKKLAAKWIEEINNAL
jgi:tetratricopeptide (TPR) repeat protein